MNKVVYFVFFVASFFATQFGIGKSDIQATPVLTDKPMELKCGSEQLNFSDVLEAHNGSDNELIAAHYSHRSHSSHYSHRSHSSHYSSRY